ncbi:MAG: hypothetical protein RI996_86 [Candidatus Parcubacteria bacterium]|jgi:mRNA-degrading endonuclease RelE of RelBE toxin-antitoxin system
MKSYNSLPAFDKELKKLLKKYPSLTDDIKLFENVLIVNPTGVGVNFSILHHGKSVQIVKARLACKSLRNRSFRIIYAYQNDTITFTYIELYFKGDKENEDRERIQEYLKIFQ